MLSASSLDAQYNKTPSMHAFSLSGAMQIDMFDKLYMDKKNTVFFFVPHFVSQIFTPITLVFTPNTGILISTLEYSLILTP
jgi:hypothetical protein